MESTYEKKRLPHFCLPFLLEIFIDKQHDAAGYGARIKATQAS